MILLTQPIGRSEVNDPKQQISVERGDWTLEPWRRFIYTDLTLTLVDKYMHYMEFSKIEVISCNYEVSFRFMSYELCRHTVLHLLQLSDNVAKYVHPQECYNIHV